MSMACPGGPTGTSRAPLRAGPSYGLPGQAPEQRGWVKIQSAKSTKAGQDSAGVDNVRRVMRQQFAVLQKMLLDTVRDDPVCRRLMTAQGSARWLR
jgi:hypothetical protein